MDIAEKLWDLSNAITAFAVLQPLTYAYGFKDAKFRDEVRAIADWIMLGTVFMTLGYLVAIVRINETQVSLIVEEPKNLLIDTTNLVCFFKSMAVLAAGSLALGLTSAAGKAPAAATQCTNKEPASCDAGST